MAADQRRPAGRRLVGNQAWQASHCGGTARALACLLTRYGVADLRLPTAPGRLRCDLTSSSPPRNFVSVSAERAKQSKGCGDRVRQGVANQAPTQVVEWVTPERSQRPVPLKERRSLGKPQNF